MTVEWLQRAIEERGHQLLYIAQYNVRAAIEQGERIELHVNLLEQHAELGRPGRRRGTRELVIAGTPFVVIYRVRQRTKTVEILRLLHGAQKWPPKSG